MKNTFLTAALVAIVGLALVGAPVTAQAQTSTNTAPATPAAASTPTKTTKTKPTDYKGSITAISASSLTVASTQKTLTLAITPKTKFAFIKAKKEKVPATPADFAVGDAVTGSYSTDATGTLTANSVHKKAPATSTAAPAAAPAQ